MNPSGRVQFVYVVGDTLPAEIDDSTIYVVGTESKSIYVGSNFIVSDLTSDFETLRTYIENYLESEDFIDDIKTALQQMVDAGAFDDLIAPIVQQALPGVVADQIDDSVASQIAEPVSDWLEAHVDPSGQCVTDDTLSIHGAAADAKAAGDAIADIVKVSETAPSSDFNRIWIVDDEVDEVEVPTMDEFTSLKSAFTNITSIIGKQLNTKVLANVGISINDNALTSVTGTYTAYFEVNTSKVYKIIKALTSRFIVAGTSALPAVGVSLSTSVWRDDTKTETTFEINDNTNYVCVMFYVSSLDTEVTLQNTLNSIFVYSPTAEDWNAKYERVNVTNVWNRNALAVTTGEPTNNLARLRTSRLSYPSYVFIDTIGTASFLVFAYNKTTHAYVGVLKTNGNFEQTSSSLDWRHTFDLSDYPSYEFAFVVRDNDNTSANMYEDFTNYVYLTKSTDINSYEYENAYVGEKIDTVKNHGFTLLPIVNPAYSTSSNNDSAVYNGMIVVGQKYNNLVLYDLATREKLAEYAFENEHLIFNTICFSNTFYNNNDLLPLLYAREEENTYAVIRITDTANATIIKRYKFETSVSSNYPFALWDFNNSVVYVIGSGSPTSSLLTLTVYDTSNETQNEDGTYSYALNRTVQFNTFLGTRHRQGGKCHNGKLYVMASNTVSPYDSRLFVIDPNTIVPTVNASVPLTYDFTEGEGIAIDPNNGKLYVNDYKCVFELLQN